MKSLDRINRSLRRGAITSLALLCVMGTLYVVVVAPRLLQLRSAAHPALGLILSALILPVLVTHARGALRTLRTRLTPEKLVMDGPGESTGLHWEDVVRLRFDSQRIVLERRGAPAAVVPLMYLNRPDELWEAICALVLARAIQGPDS